MAIYNLGRLTILKDTASNVEDESGALGEILFGVDTDTGKLGFTTDDGATWTWITSGGASFDDTEGDPVDTDATAAADGTSDHPARRDHRHHLGDHNHAASEITSGTIDQARLGSGSGGAGAKFLADDQTYKTPAGGSVTLKEIDGSPSIAGITEIRVTNGTLTDVGGGVGQLDFGSAATDGAAIHDNVASEISAITEKTTPADADMIIIEDSEDTNKKKMVQIGNLPSGGSTISRVVGSVLHDSGALGSAGAFDTGTISCVGFDYLTLELIDCRASANVNAADARLSYNADVTGTNYSSGYQYGGGTSFNDANCRNIASIPGGSATANLVASFSGRLLSPAGSNKKNLLCEGSGPISTTSVAPRAYFLVWHQTSAITRIQIDINNATTTFAAGSRLLVTGWKAENIT